MKKFIVTLSAVALMSGAALAGSCNSGDHTHDKAEKTSATMTKAEAKMDIVETAINAGSFTTLVAAVKAAGLVEALQGDGPFTVFAPTDEAFAALPEGTVEALLKDPKSLASILTYHVVEGKVTSGEVVKLDKAATLNGQEVKIATSDQMVMINDATVVSADIMCSNGVIHVIDKVILPEKN